MKQACLFVLLPVFLISSLLAQDQSMATVDEISVCTAVEDRQPVGIDTSFTSAVEQLYCYTKLTSPQDTTVISHVWFHNEEQMASIKLTMKAKTWRTWSSKRIVPEWTGDWRVEVQDENGMLLSTKSFKIK